MAEVRVARNDKVPDGLKVAQDGSVWVAGRPMAAGSPCSMPTARIARTSQFLADGHQPLLRGDDLRDLYIVTGSRGGPHENCGSIFHTRPDVPGLPLPPAKVAL
jgi:gluconolactonase